MQGDNGAGMQHRAAAAGNETQHPQHGSGTDGFTWRTIILGIVAVPVVVAAVYYGLPLLFK